jgi:hypothetical protein
METCAAPGRSPRPVRHHVIALGVAVALTAACSDGGGSAAPPPTVDLDGRVVLAAALDTFDGCDALLDHLRTEAADRVGPWGLEGGMHTMAGPAIVDDLARGAAEAGADGAVAESAGVSTAHSTTNVQEAGVDEPDVVKSDGERLVSVVGDELRVVDVRGDELRLLGSHRLDGWGSQLLVAGDRALVLSGASGDDGGPRPLPMPGPAGDAEIGWAPHDEVARLIELDLTAPADIRVVATLEVHGSHLSARLVGTTARVVVRSRPALAFVQPGAGSEAAMARATEANREVVSTSTLEDWLPSARLDDGDERGLADCDAVHRPSHFAGFGSLSVLTVDLAAGLDAVGPGDAVSVLSGGDTVYASATSLYVATTAWEQPEVDGPDGEARTDLHRFAFDTAGPARYSASGSVAGRLLNQFALSEHGDHLRVATTEGEPWDAVEASESAVTVLADREGELVAVGRVGGMGRGEQIHAVRFLGDVGYVVTFRQVDPFYTLDLRDPTAPQVVGELKIPGYSSYLHPLGDDLVLGVGQDATDEGRTTGLQVSLFDVADPAAPERLHRFTVPGGTSAVEHDHRSFLWWAPTGTAVLPFERWDRGDAVAEPVRPGIDPAPAPDEPSLGALALGVGRGGIVEQGRLRHPTAPDEAWRGAVVRSAVVGDRLLTVSELGIQTVDLHTLAPHGWLPFA